MLNVQRLRILREVVGRGSFSDAATALDYTQSAVPLAIATFRAAHPDIELSLAEGEPEDIAPRLGSGEIDVALLFDFPGVTEPPGGGLWTEQLLEDPLHVALPASHRLARRPELRLKDLRAEAWVQT